MIRRTNEIYATNLQAGLTKPAGNEVAAPTGNGQGNYIYNNSTNFKAALSNAISTPADGSPVGKSSTEALRQAFDLPAFPTIDKSGNSFPKMGNIFHSNESIPDLASFEVNIPPIRGNVAQVDTRGLSNSNNDNMNDTMRVLQQPLKGVAYPSVDSSVDPMGSRATHGGTQLAKYDKLINEASSKYGVDPALIKAVIRAESNGNPVARSKSGARGLMQLMPKTAAELGVKNSYDPKENIDGGTMYLRQLLDRYNGDVKSALVAYNWGMGNLERRPGKIPADTRNYLAKVQNFYTDYANGQQMPRQFLA